MFKILPLTLTGEFYATASLMGRSTTLGILALGMSMANNMFHWCLVRSQSVAGTGRFLAGLFAFLNWQPNASQLRANGRNWFRTSIRTGEEEKTSQSFFTLSFAT